MISSGQPSVNPRLVKEADCLSDAGYEVTVIYAYWNAWASAFDEDLLATKKWKSVRAAGHPINERRTYLLSKLIYRAAKKINAISGGRLLADVAIARPAYFLNREAKKHKAHLYIAHNLGALPAALNAAKTHKAACGFDAEDFHRNEVNDDSRSVDVVLKTTLEDRYLTQVDYFTTSSPQIADAYQKLYPALKPAVLLNVFPNSDIEIKKVHSGPIKLFWFSQTIGSGRGLNDLVKVSQLLDPAQFEIHLLGNQSAGDVLNRQILDSGVNFHFHAPVAPGALIEFAAQFDIGLALENRTPYNRDICLTNKIFTYLQAGLAVIASDTVAQKEFMQANNKAGFVYPNGDAEALARLISNLYADRNLLNQIQNQALTLAHNTYNWETESQKLFAVVKQALAN